MSYTGLTPIHEFSGVYVKREDLAHWNSFDYPSGSKVRQYNEMANGPFNEGSGTLPPMIVGCSANSCQQIYVAAAAHIRQVKGYIFVPERRVKSDATLYCERMGAEITYVKPGYLSVVRKAARAKALQLHDHIEWNARAAVIDTAEQYKNVPYEGIKRIIVPTGSGLTAAGVVLGAARRFDDATDSKGWAKKPPEIVVVATSPMASKSKIETLAMAIGGYSWVHDITFMGPTTPYDTPVVDKLPDGTPLDPFYAAKAWQIVEQGDLFWPPGLRPVIAMPEVCREAFQAWEGPAGL